MKKYFGILNNEKVNALEVEALFDFYIKNDLFYVSHSYLIDKIETESPKIDLKPSQMVINAFYNYLTVVFDRNINQQFLQFFSDFNDKIYGLGNKEQQKIALKHFNKLYKKVKVLEASFVKREKDNNGIEQVKNMNRFDFLQGRQNAQKQQVATTENILQFLNGNDTYFNSEQFNNEFNTKQFVTFEANLKILVSLNGQYHFEEDLQFTDLGQLKRVYQKHEDIFKTFEVFNYVHQKIQSFTVSKLIHITSLYDALSEMNLIQGTEIDFLNYVNEEHQIGLSKLKFYELGEHSTYDKKVQQFKLELQAFSPEKVEAHIQNIEKPVISTVKKKKLKVFTDKDALDYLFKNTFNCD